MGHDPISRAILPIPHQVAPGLTTYDAKDPDTAYPPFEPLNPHSSIRFTDTRQVP